MTQERITIKAIISADKQKVWDYYTQPEHITKWNFADPRWHCPAATNDLKVGGRYVARMEAKDGSFGFDFIAVYTEINQGESFTYEFGGRHATVEFKETNGQTEVTITFDPETQNSIEFQRNGWQAILDNFKKYVEMKMEIDSPTPKNIDEYIATFPPNVRQLLEKIRVTIREAAPDAKEKISYRMPTFYLKGNLVHFAAFKNHIGFYPTPSGIERFEKEISAYKSSKGTVQFPLDQPIPYDLIGKIVKFRVEENLEKAKSKRKK